MEWHHPSHRKLAAIALLFITYFPWASEKHVVRVSVFFPFSPPPIWSHLCLELSECNYPLAKLAAKEKLRPFDCECQAGAVRKRESPPRCAMLPKAGNIKRDESHHCFVLAQHGVNKNVWIHERVGAGSAKNGK